jgi:hypothetical protein
MKEHGLWNSMEQLQKRALSSGHLKQLRIPNGHDEDHRGSAPAAPLARARYPPRCSLFCCRIPAHVTQLQRPCEPFPTMTLDAFFGRINRGSVRKTAAIRSFGTKFRRRDAKRGFIGVRIAITGGSMATVHGWGSAFIHMSNASRVAGIEPAA